jgi:hypothetical protein
MTSTHMEPRPYQTRIVRKTLDMFAGTYRDGKGDLVPAVRSVMIESPTGSGKTYMALMIAKALQQQTGARIGWVAMRRNLLEQIKAENERHRFGVDLQTISMFDKSPPTDIDLLVVDECVPGDTILDVLVDGQPHQARMDEVVFRGVGSAVLSRNDGGELEYQTIVSRTPMGRKELLEVIIDTEESQQVLLITEEGRVWTEAGYRRPLELLGSTVLCKSSRCQTYLYGQRTTESPGTLRGDSTEDGTGCSSVCLRLRPAGSVVPLHEEVQDVPLQPSSAAGVGVANSETAADYSWDDAGRRVRHFCSQSADGRADQRTPAYPAFDAAAAGTHRSKNKPPPDPRQTKKPARQTKAQNARAGSGVYLHPQGNAVRCARNFPGDAFSIQLQKTVAHTIHRFNKTSCIRVGFQLAAQIFYVRIHTAVDRGKSLAVQLIQKLLARHRLPGVARQHCQQFELIGRQAQLFAVQAH